MHTYQRTVGATVLALALSLGTAACSSAGGSAAPASDAQVPASTPSPSTVSADSLAKQAVVDLAKASSYRIDGTVDVSAGRLTLDLTVAAGKG